jgi:hypothetical protein
MISVENAQKAVELVSERQRIAAVKWNALIDSRPGYREDKLDAADDELQWAIEQYRKRRLDAIDAELRALGVDPSTVTAPKPERVPYGMPGPKAKASPCGFTLRNPETCRQAVLGKVGKRQGSIRTGGRPLLFGLPALDSLQAGEQRLALAFVFWHPPQPELGRNPPHGQEAEHRHVGYRLPFANSIPEAVAASFGSAPLIRYCRLS